MNRILLINIDPPYRSIYSATIAALFKKKYPSAKISVVVSSDNDLFNTLNIFETVLPIDVEIFFKNTSKLENDVIENQMRSFLGPVIGTKWDLVVNLSSNLLGSIFTCFLSAQKIMGAYALPDDPTILYSNISSFLLCNIPDEHNNYFHFTYLYRDIVGIYYDMAIKSIWEEKLRLEFDTKIKSILSESNKKQIVLIDTNIKNNPKLGGASNLLSDLFLEFNKDSDILPVFFSNQPQEETQMLDQLGSLNKGKVYFVRCLNRAQLSLFHHASLVITDDLYLKSIADLSLVPSILLTKNVNPPLSDFSVVNRSHLIHFKQSEPQLPEVIIKIVGKILRGADWKLSKDGLFDVYQTSIYETLPVLQLESQKIADAQTYAEYAKWWLSLKFLAQKRNLNLPSTKLQNPIYKQVVLLEKQRIMNSSTGGNLSIEALKDLDGLWPLEAKTFGFQKDKQPAHSLDPKQELSTIRAKMLNFLAAEESSLG